VVEIDPLIGDAEIVQDLALGGEVLLLSRAPRVADQDSRRWSVGGASAQLRCHLGVTCVSSGHRASHRYYVRALTPSRVFPPAVGFGVPTADHDVSDRERCSRPPLTRQP